MVVVNGVKKTASINFGIKSRLNRRRDSMGGLFKIILCFWLWVALTVFFSLHPLPDMPVWASSLGVAILMAGFIAYSDD